MAENPILYTNYDFETLLAQLQSRVALRSAWKDMYRSATGSMLIELFAAVGTMVLYYVERRAEESYISTAQNYSSVVNLARLLNYIPSRNISATGTLRFSLSTAATNMVFIPKWTACSVPNGKSFLVANDGVIMPGQTYVDVTGIQGSLVTISNTASGTSNQEFNLADTQVENTNLTVTVNGVEWTKVTSFLTSTNTSTHYVIKPELDGTITIVFGNGVFGKSPSLGETINISYVKSDGLSGNVYDLARITTLNSTIYDSTSTIQTVTVSNTSTFLGGDDAETIEDIRNNAPAVFATGDRLVTKADFTAVINDYPSVGDSNVWGENEETNPDYDNFNQVKIAVVLQNWILPDATFKSNLSTYLYDKSLMTVRYSYVDPEILEVIPTLTIKVLQGNSLSYVQSLIETAMADQFLLGTTTKLGTAIRQSDIIAAIEDVAGVDYTYATLKIQKELLSTYDSTYNYSETVEALPLLIGGVEIYVDSTKIATDDGAGGYTSLLSDYTVTGLVNYTTGKVGVNISGSLPSPTSKIYVRYQQNENGDIVTTKNQICKLLNNEYTSIGYSS